MPDPIEGEPVGEGRCEFDYDTFTGGCDVEAHDHFWAVPHVPPQSMPTERSEK